MTETKHGYLVLADISGYTGYLAKVELEHAHEILTDLLEVIVENFKTLLTISKLEGDAIFANADEEKIIRPESLLELIENTYLTFRRRRDSSERATTCTCRACQNMQTLELKFFVHHGDYIVQNISGIRELVGSDVNLVHRLMKNHITENTGWQAYALFTQPALDAIDLSLEDAHVQDETYEHLGTVRTRTLNLIPRYEALLAAQRVIVAPHEADVISAYEFNAPVAEVWDWMMDIENRNKTMGAAGHWTIISRAKGSRSGPGSVNHCAHGKGISRETILDWRPFEYSTAEVKDGMATFYQTYLFVPLDDGKRTRLEVRIKMFKPWPVFLAQTMVKMQFKKEDPYRAWFGDIAKLIEKEDKSRLPEHIS